LTDKEPETIEVPDHATTEGWKAAAMSDRKTVVLNGTTYLTKEIVDVTEVNPRRGSTNMEGI